MLSAIAIFAVSCSGADGSEINSAVCASWQPIYGSQADTDLTLRQILASNLARQEWCN